MRFSFRAGVMLILLTLSAPLAAAIDDLRITEVSPSTDTVEVYNSGPAFTQATDAYFFYSDNTQPISLGTSWTAGEYKTIVLTVNGGLNPTISDIWLYRSPNYNTASELVHGMKYGGSATTGKETVAFAAGKWPTPATYVPLPGGGQTAAWDLFGFTQYDWYIDATPTFGTADSTPPGAVTDTLAWPSGSSTFENVSLGNDITNIQNWVLVDTGAIPGEYTVRAVNDSLTVTGTRPAGTTQWLRIRDANIVDQNRFYSPTITAAVGLGTYTWTWYVYIEQPISGSAATKPKFVIQHDNTGFFNAWGIELTSTNFNLVVLGATSTPAGIGGTAASTSIASILNNQWVKLDLTANFDTNQVSGRVNNGTPVNLNINLTGDKLIYRWCYRGEGTDNAATILVDDISMAGTTGQPPVVGVTANSLPVTNGGTVNVAAGATLASLNLQINVTDPDTGSTVSVSGTVSNVTTQGILDSQFSSALMADPYTLSPTTGTFNVPSVNHVVDLTVTDNQGNIVTFSFTIAVAANAAPVITVNSGVTTVLNAGNVNVEPGATLASLLMSINITDTDPNSTVTLVGSVSNVTTQGFLNSEFSQTSLADPFSRTPNAGTFTVQTISHVVSLTATDNFGTATPFSFTFVVATSAAPTIVVKQGAAPIANAATINVLAGTTIASLNLDIDVDDSDANAAVTLAGSVSAITTEGVLDSEFSSASTLAPYTVSPLTGSFIVGSTTHVVSLLATDNFGVSGTFTFTISVGTATPPTISVTRKGVPVVDGSVLEVIQSSTLLSNLISITVSDIDVGSTVSLAASITNVTTQGIIASQFTSTAAADPYAVNPISGIFTVVGITHTVTLTATDNLGLQGTFTFGMRVTKGSGPRQPPGGDCTAISGAQTSIAPLAAIIGAALVRRRRKSKAR
ncbi:MAG: hypothetical protein IT462_00990 [Planctomycetes bacterium]|nr:hypothetical protein [Planctomycetota bacterium]